MESKKPCRKQLHKSRIQYLLGRSRTFMRSYWCDINHHLLKIMESRCPNTTLQTSGRLLSSHSTLPLNIWQPLHPCTPPPSPTASQHLPHTSLNLRSKSSQKLKAQCSKGGDLESHAGWGWNRVCFYFFPKL